MGNTPTSSASREVNFKRIIDLTRRLVETKDHAIIWHDPNIHSDENKQYIDQLKQYCEVLTFTDWKEALTKISGTQTCYHVITSGNNGEPLTFKISSLPNVLAISVFCGDVDLHKRWAQGYPKVVCIENNFQNLQSQLTISVVKWQRQTSVVRCDFPSFAPIFDDNDKSDINKQHFYLTGLTKNTDREQGKIDFLTLASAIYKDKDNMENFQKNYNKYSMRSILNWYTKESFLYKTTNNCLRIGTSESVLYCRLIVNDLEIAIKERYNKKSKEYNGLLYRGAYLSDEEWQKLQQNIGKDIEMYGFLSTTKDKSVAVKFALADVSKKVLITMVIPAAPDIGEQGFAEVKEFSDFEDEEEVLFNVRSRFTISEATVEFVEGNQCRHLVLLYGRQAIRKSLTLQRAVIEISFKNKDYLRCCMCDLDIKLSDREHFFINIVSKKECVCDECFEKAVRISSIPLLYVSLKNSNMTSDDLKIEGIVTRYNEDFTLPFYGYTCTTCKKKSTLEDTYYYRCMSCQNASKIFCKNCFHQPSGCLSHIIVVETRPFIFWSEKMSQSEIEGLNFLTDAFQQDLGLIQQAETFFNTNEYARAAQCYEDILSQNNKNNDQMYPFWNNLGRCYEKLRNYPRSLECFSKALELKKARHGEMHSITALGYNNVGVGYIRLGEHKKALTYILKAIEISKAVSGEKNSQTAMSYKNAALIYSKFGEYKTATEYGLKSLEIRRKLFGENHPETASSYSSLGEIYMNLEKKQKTIECYTKALEIYKDIYGEKHPQTATSYACLGSIYNDSRDYNTAMEYYLKSLEIRQAIFGEQHMEVANSYLGIGLVYKNLEKHSEDLEAQRKCLTIKIALIGEKHIDLAISYLNIGVAHHNLKGFNEASEHYMKALEIYKTSCGESNDMTARVYNNIGLVCKDLKEYDNALKYFMSALEIRKAVYGEKHSDTAESYQNVGLAHYQLDNNDKAVEYYSKALELKSSILGDKDPGTANAYYNLGLAYNKKREYDKAIEHYKKALEIRKAVFGKDHAITKVLIKNIEKSKQAKLQTKGL